VSANCQFRINPNISKNGTQLEIFKQRKLSNGKIVKKRRDLSHIIKTNEDDSPGLAGNHCRRLITSQSSVKYITHTLLHNSSDASFHAPEQARRVLQNSFSEAEESDRFLAEIGAEKRRHRKTEVKKLKFTSSPF